MARRTGSSGDDNFSARDGNDSVDAFGGNDTITFNFKLTDATISYVGNQVIVDTATSHTVLTGFEIYKFADGTIEEEDGNALVADLFYYSRNPDVWIAGVDADAHYAIHGWRELRDPNAFFDTSTYLALNPDVQRAGINPLAHFHTVGWKEGRQPSLNFDAQAYLSANPDVAAAGVDPLAHFLAFGAAEGRQSVAVASLLRPNGFDDAFYLRQNPDVAAAGVDPFWHFQIVGWKEGRNPNAYFDTNSYLAANPDVREAGVDPFDHYREFGWKEGRNPSAWFDTDKYLAANPDVKAAGVDPLTHYLQYGVAEGRPSQAEDIVDGSAATDTVQEGAAAGTKAGITAVWGNSTHAVYSLGADSSGGGFAIDPVTGVVTVADSSKLSFAGSGPSHTHTISVVATEGAHARTQSFTIAILAPANIDVPVITSDGGGATATRSVAENTTAVTTVTAVDPDGPTLSYSIAGGDDQGRFTIDATTGALSFIALANFEAPADSNLDNTYVVQVRASDGAFSALQTIAVTVTDINDNAPVFTSGTVASVEEGSSGTVYTAAATDADGTAVNNTVGYSLEAGVADNDLFEIDAAGNVTFKIAPNYQAAASFNIVVTASDGAGQSTARDVAITVADINDNAPVFTSGTVASVAEGSSGIVYTAAATDADGTAANNTVGYALEAGVADNDLFAIDASGNVTFKATPDYETDASFNIVVTASDGAGQSTTRNVAITVTDINDNAPVFISGTVASVAEGSSGIVYTAAATDADGTAANNTVGYSLEAGVADNDLFEIDAAGNVTFKVAPDYEADASFNIVVTASDGAGQSTARNVAITVTDINDNAPVFTSGTVASVAEGSSATVYTAAATDADGTAANNTVGYSLEAGVADNDLFAIDASGNITFKATPDCEADASFNIVVTASDGAGQSTARNVAITVTDINDNAPIFSSATVDSVEEDSSGIVYTAAATDADGTTPNNTISYSLEAGVADNDLFAIDAAGNVTFKIAPNYEAATSYSFTVKASDQGGLFSTKTVTVNLTNLPPVISSGIAADAINEGVAAGTAVYAAAAADPAGGTITYALVDSDDASAFSINASTGVVTINATPDYETKSQYSFTVKASDPSGAFSTRTVTLSVVDLPPVISSGNVANAIDEGAAAGTVVYTAAAADPASGAVTYALADGGDASAFSINASTGVVTINAMPDFETKNSYSFAVIASSAYGAASTKTVTLAINDINEAPVMAGDRAVTLYQGGSVVLTAADLTVIDPDAADQVSFAVTGTIRGHVALTTALGTTITSFTREQLAAGLVGFVSDGSANTAASFTVTATDGTATTAASTINVAVSVVPDPLNVTTTTNIHDANATISTLNLSDFGTLIGTGTLIVTGSATLGGGSTQSGSGTTIIRTDTTVSNIHNRTLDGRSLEFESVSASNPVELAFDGTGGSNGTMLLNNGAQLRFGSTVIGNDTVGTTLHVLQNSVTFGTTTPGASGSVVFETNSIWDLELHTSLVFNVPVSGIAVGYDDRATFGSGPVDTSITFTKGLELTPDLSNATYDAFSGYWYIGGRAIWSGEWPGSGYHAFFYPLTAVPNLTIVGDDRVTLRAAHVTFVNSNAVTWGYATEKLTLINSNNLLQPHRLELQDFSIAYEVLAGSSVRFGDGGQIGDQDDATYTTSMRIDNGTVFFHQMLHDQAFKNGLDIAHSATIDATTSGDHWNISYPGEAILYLAVGGQSTWGNNRSENSPIDFTLVNLVIKNSEQVPATFQVGSGTIDLKHGSQIVLSNLSTYFDFFYDSNLTIQSTDGSGSVHNSGIWWLKSDLGTTRQNVTVSFSTNGGIVSVDHASTKLTLAGGGTDVNARYLGTGGTVEFGGGTRTIDSASTISTSNVIFTGGTTTLHGSYGVSSTTVSGGAANLLGASTSLGAVTISGGTLDLGGGSDTAASLTQSGGTLTGTGTLTVSGAATFSGGTESGSGTTVVNGAATFFTASNQSVTLDGRTLDLKNSTQTAAFSGDAIHLNGGALLVVDTGVTFTDNSTGSGGAAFTIDGNGTLKVLGTYAKAGRGATDISAAVVNSGIIDVQAGALTLSGAVTGTGTVTIGPEGTVAFGASVGADQTIVFSATTGWLTLNAPALFEGTISGFTGTAPDAAHSDVIELVGIDFNSAQFAQNYNASTGILFVTDGIDSVSLKFNNFTGAFKLAADADGDTLIFDPPASGSLESAPRAKDASHDGPDAIHSGDIPFGGVGADSFVFGQAADGVGDAATRSYETTADPHWQRAVQPDGTHIGDAVYVGFNASQMAELHANWAI